ncbi:hypothetical protein [Cupriavidus sp. AU9028]|uniref:hypothetical protein n=1 Tax=Cupriavidus sp. AU9028 TaxID=2871157 RepID=UPI001C9880B5|nr:hypothetical protein [Cupriavidus sp. AU9028]MBY4897537.1 hypothetical protein [Cupriavidus sp. AU9028]
MNRSDDNNRNAPPSLFGTGEPAGPGDDTRILASLEGRPRSASKGARQAGRRTLHASLVLALVAVGVAVLWLGNGPDDPFSVQAPLPGGGLDTATVAAPAREDVTLGTSASSDPGPATIVDVAPTRNADDDALDHLGKHPGAQEDLSAATLTAAGAGTAAAAVATAMAGTTDRNTGVQAGNEIALKRELKEKEFSATTPATSARQNSTASTKVTTTAKATNATGKPGSGKSEQVTKVGKAKGEHKRLAARSSNRPTARTTSKDRDAELLAALLAPTPEEKAAQATSTRKTGARRSQ